MSDDRLIAELLAAASSLATAKVAAEAGDWTAAEQGILDAQELLADPAGSWPQGAHLYPRSLNYGKGG